MKENFGLYVKELREEYGYTLSDLAYELDCSDAYLSQIENNRRKNTPTIEFLKKMSVALDTSFAKLLDVAGHHDLAEGQYLKELFGDIKSSNTYKLMLNGKEKTLEEDESLLEVVEQTYLNVQAIIAYVEDERFKGQELREEFMKFNNVLALYKDLIESTAENNSKWNMIEKKNSDGIDKKLFLKINTLNEVNNLIERISD